MEREFKCKKKYWDDYKKQWITIVVEMVSHNPSDTVIVRGDHGGYVAKAFQLYEPIRGKSFDDNIICKEHLTLGIPYPYYCPSRGENCFECEVEDYDVSFAESFFNF